MPANKELLEDILKLGGGEALDDILGLQPERAGAPPPTSAEEAEGGGPGILGRIGGNLADVPGAFAGGAIRTLLSGTLRLLQRGLVEAERTIKAPLTSRIWPLTEETKAWQRMVEREHFPELTPEAVETRMLQRWSRAVDRFVAETAALRPDTALGELSAGVGSVVGSLVPAALATMAAGPVAGVAVGAGLESQEAYDETYEQLLAQRMDAQEAADKAGQVSVAYGLASIPLEGLEIDGVMRFLDKAARKRFLKRTAENFVRRTRGRALRELGKEGAALFMNNAVQEATQQLAQEGLAYEIADISPQGGIKGLLIRSGKAGLTGGLGGLLVGGAGRLLTGGRHATDVRSDQEKAAGRRIQPEGAEAVGGEDLQREAQAGAAGGVAGVREAGAGAGALQAALPEAQAPVILPGEAAAPETVTPAIEEPTPAAVTPAIQPGQPTPVAIARELREIAAQTEIHQKVQETYRKRLQNMPDGTERDELVREVEGNATLLRALNERRKFLQGQAPGKAARVTTDEQVKQLAEENAGRDFPVWVDPRTGHVSIATWGGENARGQVTGAIGKDADWSPDEPSGLVVIVKGEGTRGKGPITAHLPVTDFMEAEDLNLGAYPKGWIAVRNLAKKRGIDLAGVVGPGSRQEVIGRLEKQRGEARTKRLAKWQSTAQAAAAQPAQPAAGPAIMPGEGRPNAPTIEPGAAPETVAPKIEKGEREVPRGHWTPPAEDEAVQRRLVARVLRTAAERASGADRAALLAEAHALENRGSEAKAARGAGYSLTIVPADAAIERIAGDPWLSERRAELAAAVGRLQEAMKESASGKVLLLRQRDIDKFTRERGQAEGELNSLATAPATTDTARRNLELRREGLVDRIAELDRILLSRLHTDTRVRMFQALKEAPARSLGSMKRGTVETDYDFMHAVVATAYGTVTHQLGSYAQFQKEENRQIYENVARQRGVSVGEFLLQGLRVTVPDGRQFWKVRSALVDAARSLSLYERTGGRVPLGLIYKLVVDAKLGSASGVRILDEAKRAQPSLSKVIFEDTEGRELTLAEILTDEAKVYGVRFERQETYGGRKGFITGSAWVHPEEGASMLEEYVAAALQNPNLTTLRDAAGKPDLARIARVRSVVQEAAVRGTNPLAALIQGDASLIAPIGELWEKGRAAFARYAEDTAWGNYDVLGRWLKNLRERRARRMKLLDEAFKTAYAAQQASGPRGTRPVRGGTALVMSEEAEKIIWKEIGPNAKSYFLDMMPLKAAGADRGSLLLTNLDYDPATEQAVPRVPAERRPRVYPGWAGTADSRGRLRPGQLDRLQDPELVEPRIVVHTPWKWDHDSENWRQFQVPDTYQDVIDSFNGTFMRELATVDYSTEHHPVSDREAELWRLDYEKGLRYEADGRFQFESGGRVRITISPAPGREATGRTAGDPSIWPSVRTLREEFYHGVYHVVRAGNPELAARIDAAIDARAARGLGRGLIRDLTKVVSAIENVPPNQRTESQRDNLARCRSRLAEALPIYRSQVFAETMAAIDEGDAAGPRHGRAVSDLEKSLGEWRRGRPPAIVAEVRDFLRTTQTLSPELRERLAEYAEEQGERPEYAAAMRRPTPPQAQAPRTDVEERLRQARGIETAPLMTRIRDAVMNMVHAATRAQRNLPNDAEHAVANEFFRLLKNLPLKVSDMVSRNVGHVIEHLSPDDLVLMERLMIGRNMLDALQQGQPLRFGFQDEAEVQAWNRRMETAAAQNPRVRDALARQHEVREFLVQRLVDFDILPQSTLANIDSYFHQQVLSKLTADRVTGGTSARRITRSAQRSRIVGPTELGADYDYNTSYIEAEWTWMAELSTELEKEQLLRTLGSCYDIKDQLKSEAAAAGLPANEWRQMLRNHEGYELWQPKPGNVFFQAYTIPEQVAEQIILNMPNPTGITADQLREMLVMGSPNRQFALPHEIVQELNQTTKPAPAGPVAKLANSAMRGWKVWTLLNPKRALAYNLRNVTGDIDPMLGSAAGAFKYAGQAIQELYDYYKGGRTLSPRLREARNLAVISSSLTVSEIPQLKDLKIFKRFHDSSGGLMDAADWYFEKARRYSEFRENVLRYAAYLYYFDKLNANSLTNYGGAKREVVDKLAMDMGNHTAAAHLARNLMGDYGNRTVFGNWMRQRLFPFFSWVEVNLHRYPRLMINAAKAGELKHAMGAGAAASSLYGAMAVLKLGLFYGLVHTFNRLAFPDDDDKLTDDDRASLHITLGHNADGTVRVFRNVGALGDFAEWFGLQELLALYPRYQAGQLDFNDVLIQMAKAPFNKLAFGLRPEITSGFPILTGMSLYPDAFNPRPIERLEAVARTMGLHEEARGLKGMALGTGERMRPHYWERAVVGVVDPAEAALSEMYILRANYLESIGRDRPPVMGRSSARTMRQAIAQRDYEAFEQAASVYLAKGKDYKAFKAAVSYFDPIAAGLSAKDEERFEQEFLNGDQRGRLKIARDYAQRLQVQAWQWFEQMIEGREPGERFELERQMEAEIAAKVALIDRTARKGMSPRDVVELEQSKAEARMWLRDRGIPLLRARMTAQKVESRRRLPSP